MGDFLTRALSEPNVRTPGRQPSERQPPPQPETAIPSILKEVSKGFQRLRA